jgi:DNA polymerase
MSGDAGRDVAEWLHYLSEIGVRELRAGGEARAGAPAEPVETASRGEPPVVDPLPDVQGRAQSAARGTGSARPAPTPAPRSGDLFTLGAETDDEHDPVATLAAIRDELGDCTRCKLHEQRTHVVFGVGNPRARLMFIGEGPGADEDAQGEPFVGRAGKKLNEMIQAIGLAREDVYIANVVKCRPPGNRDPESDEVATCSPFLFRQIAAIRPRVIVTLGAPAARTVLGFKGGISKIRGTWQSCRGIDVMPTYHPAYLLRAYTPENRRKVWDDLKTARARMDEEP